MNALKARSQKQLTQFFSASRNKIPSRLIGVSGRLTRTVGLTLEAEGCVAPLGALCEIETDNAPIWAEVVGFHQDRLFLMPTGDIHGLRPHARVTPAFKESSIAVGDALLGRVIDPQGQPMDGLGPVMATDDWPMSGKKINPMDKEPIKHVMDVGIEAINGLLTVGRGQRLGLFAGTGVGKSVLLGMMTRFTQAEVVVVGLIGERGREVQEFVHETLGPEGRKKAVVVVAPADAPPLMRLHGAMVATSVAEYFRAKGKHVLLLMDSLTRFAQAQREIALSVGEPPATKGYPPSVFAKLPHLVERSGNGVVGGGSITAIYTVLADGDDLNDPVVDSARGVLDGHFVLSRVLAGQGTYPAIDIEKSVSRVMNEIVSPEQSQTARDIKELYSAYMQNVDLVSVGAYQHGSNPTVDRALNLYPKIIEYIRQERSTAVSYPQSVNELNAILQG